ncbi:MAG: LysR substrate-binding domain-containing protein [Roseovarius sp.]
MPSLNALRAYEAAARHLSYQRAAEELHVTAPAVKQLVAKLEASLGVTLIRRKGRSLELTEQGRRGQEDLARAMQLLGTSVSKFRDRPRQSRLVVSVEASLSTSWLVPRLEGFRARHPDVTVLIDSNQEVVDLRQGQIDVAIRYGVEREEGLHIHRLFDDEIFPVCSPALVQGPTPLKTLIDLQHVPLIHWDISQLTWATQTRRWFTWDSWITKMGGDGISVEHGLYFSEYGQAVQAAIAGQGVVLASWPILRDPVEAGLLVAPFQHRLSTDIGYEIATTEQAAQRPMVAAFIDWVLEAAQTA